MSKEDKIKEYTEKFARDKHISVEEAKEYLVVKEYEKYVRSEPNHTDSVNSVSIDCGC